MIESDRELSAMVQELWDNDINRLKPGKDYRISLQVHHALRHTQTPVVDNSIYCKLMTISDSLHYTSKQALFFSSELKFLALNELYSVKKSKPGNLETYCKGKG